ncbi:MAG TPA: neutral/alkaline non-lysosomal ceramidase N-terminal domain-containing protein [Thermomicrobiales bacterium]
MPENFRAGVGRVVITPPLTAPHAGWGAQTHILPDGVEADLWATVLVVDDGRETAAYVDLDLVIVSREESDAIRAAVGGVLGIPATAVRCSVTHSHAGPPPSAWDWAERGKDELAAYYRYLPTLAASAAAAAKRDLRTARLAVGTGQSNVAVNRRETAPNGRTITGVNPDGPIDPQVLVVRIDAQSGDPIAAIVGYTMHPTTLGPSNRLLSPDWPGHLKRMVEQLTGATCLFAQGATGDIGPGPDGYTDDTRVIHRLGAEIGCEAARVWFGLRLPPVIHRHDRTWESGAPLGKWAADAIPEKPIAVRTATQTVELPLLPQPSLPEAEAAATEATNRLTALRASGASAAEIEAATFVVKRTNMTLSRARWFAGKASFPSELHLLQIGPVVFAGAECEPFSAIGKAIKARSPFPHTWFGGYTGGWFGYVPTPEEYSRRGYEVDTSPYTPEAAKALEEQTVAALATLANEV